MILIPATDLMNGKCVRLSQGKFDQQTIYNENPVDQALKFQEMGFTHLHLVDLDGARKREPVHLDVLKNVSGKTDLFIDYSGGVKGFDNAEKVFELGANAITIGSLAVNDPESTLKMLQQFGSEKLILGADVKNGYIATHGWENQTETELFEFLNHYLGKGFSKVMITDVSKDGMMSGPAIELYREVMSRFTGIQLIASGGIACMDDIYKLRDTGCFAAITGKALYENKLDIKELQKYLQS